MSRVEAGGETRRDVEAREAAHWDALAGRLTEAELRVGALAGDAVAVRRLARLGPLEGKCVLDLGCGTGLWSVILAQRGAEVWAIDISPESVAVTRRRAALHGLGERVHASVMSATALEFPAAFFDLVHGQDIIHHVDPDLLGAQVARVLVPGGRAVFCENCANNPVLLLARRTLCGRWGIPKWSSADEYPLTRERRDRFARFFRETEVEYPCFVFFHLVDAYLFRFKSRPVSRLCDALDRGVYSALPFLRPYSYRQLICCRRPLAPGYLQNE